MRLILRNIDRHKEQKRLEPSLNRDRQRGKEAAKSKTKGPAFCGEGFSTVEDMHGNVINYVVDFTAHEIIEDDKKMPRW